MTALSTTLNEKLQTYAQRNVTRVKLGLTDIDGVIRGKYVSIDKFAGLLSKGGGFCDCIFGWDVNDQLYTTSTFTGWHTGFPDAQFRLLVDTERWLADEGCPFFIGEFVASDGGLHALCPRSCLVEQIRHLASAGLMLKSGFEYEFFVFDETSHSLRDKGYRDLKSLTPGNFGYSVLRASTHGHLFSGLMDYAASLNCDLEALHCETGPGVWEAALQAETGVEAADRANLFKTFSKVYFARQERVATFMAKWSMDYPGQSGHYHFSFLDSDDGNAFYDADDAQGMNELQRQAVAGLQRYLPELLVLLAPTINSYTRLVRGAWAPTASTWGVENRTCAIRVVPAGLHAQRIEVRVGGADANPYLVASAVTACALAGIAERLAPGAPIEGNAYDIEDQLPPERRFASNLREAAQRLDESTMARRALGDTFVDHFVMSRRWECTEYERHLNSWQLERYFEII